MNIQIRIGEVAISIEGNADTADWEIAAAYQSFIQPGKGAIGLRLHRGIPESPAGAKIFESPPIWALYREKGQSVIHIFESLPGPKRLLVISEELDKADLYFPDQSSRFDDPFYGPTMELLVINYLAQGKGAVIHTCGIERAGKGILFVGESGAGKSTLARLWDEARVAVLSDDRIIVRKKGDQFWMYGTPWHGDASFASPRGVTVERVLFLRQGRENSIKEIKGIDSVSRLITCGFLPHWDPQGMAFSMELFTDLAAHVPCHELSFVPNTSVIDFIQEFCDEMP